LVIIASFLAGVYPSR